MCVVNPENNHMCDPRSLPDIARIERMGSVELARVYWQIFAKAVPAGNPELARRKIAWHVQALREGGVPEQIRQFALAIARNQRLTQILEGNRSRRSRGLPLPNTITASAQIDHDSRVPLPGAVLVKNFRGEIHIAHVLDEGFEYRGERFASLSALANRISGARWNGYVFFGLQRGGHREK